MRYMLTQKDQQLVDKMEQAREALADKVDDLRAQYDDATYEWRESDRGIFVENWLDQVQEALEEIEVNIQALTELTAPEE